MLEHGPAPDPMHGLSDRLGSFVDQQHRHSSLAVRPIPFIKTCNNLVGANAHRRAFLVSMQSGRFARQQRPCPQPTPALGPPLPRSVLCQTSILAAAHRRGCPPTPTRGGQGRPWQSPPRAPTWASRSRMVCAAGGRASPAPQNSSASVTDIASTSVCRGRRGGGPAPMPGTASPLLRQRVDLENLDFALDYGYVAGVAQPQPNGPGGSQVPAGRTVRRRGHQQRLAVPVERQRHQIWRTVRRGTGHPDIDVVGSRCSVSRRR